MFGIRRTKTNLSTLSDPYIDSMGEVWETHYRYDAVEIQLANCKLKDLELNQSVEFVCDIQTVNTRDISSIKVFSPSERVFIGFIVSGVQRDMIYNHIRKDGHMVKGQISSIARNKVTLRIYYYRSQTYLEHQRAIYEAEKAAYKRRSPIIFDVTLIGNNSEKMQWEISHACIGNKVEIWEEDENKYAVETLDSYDLGYIPKSVSRKVRELEDTGYEPNGEITEIINEEERYIVKIRLTLEDRNYM